MIKISTIMSVFVFVLLVTSQGVSAQQDPCPDIEEPGICSGLVITKILDNNNNLVYLRSTTPSCASLKSNCIQNSGYPLSACGPIEGSNTPIAQCEPNKNISPTPTCNPSVISNTYTQDDCTDTSASTITFTTHHPIGATFPTTGAPPGLGGQPVPFGYKITAKAYHLSWLCYVICATPL